MDRDGSYYYFHADGLGSVTAITDSSATPVQTYSYDSFGVPKQTTTFRNSFMYVGKEYDSETGLTEMGARYYDPREGRFVSKDPVAFAGGINIYTYTNNNVINKTDPSGLATIDITLPSLDIPLPGWCSAAMIRALSVASFAATVLTIPGDTPVCNENGEPKGCRDDKGGGKWMCEGNAKYDIKGTPKHVIMGPWIVAYGNTAVEASHNWIKACQASAPLGHTARHIQPRCRKIR